MTLELSDYAVRAGRPNEHAKEQRNDGTFGYLVVNKRGWSVE